MSCRDRARAATVVTLAILAAQITMATAGDLGRKATPSEVALWDIDVLPDGAGLPSGRGTVMKGAKVFEENCSSCHGAHGEGGIGGALTGGEGSLASDHPVKTVGSYWPFATTLFDYVRRAMPYPAPGSLSDDDVYSVSAFILNLNGIIPPDAALDRSSLPRINMPNRQGFKPDAAFSMPRR